MKNSTLQGTNTSHLGKRKIIFGKGYVRSQEGILIGKKTWDPGAPSTKIPKPKMTPNHLHTAMRLGLAVGSSKKTLLYN